MKDNDTAVEYEIDIHQGFLILFNGAPQEDDNKYAEAQIYAFLYVFLYFFELFKHQPLLLKVPHLAHAHLRGTRILRHTRICRSNGLLFYKKSLTMFAIFYQKKNP